MASWSTVNGKYMFRLVYIYQAFLVQIVVRADNKCQKPSWATTNCDGYKFKVYHPNQPGSCMQCKICPSDPSRRSINKCCEGKLPGEIPNQGNAWCTGINDSLPWCMVRKIKHGKLSCTNDNRVYSRCHIVCDKGYELQDNIIECKDDLRWNDSSSPKEECHRKGRPDKPTIESSSRKENVKSGTEVILTCRSNSEVVGRMKTFWYHRGLPLASDAHQSKYIIHDAQSENSGVYVCAVEDDIGQSDFSADYILEVHAVPPYNSTLTIVLFIYLCKRPEGKKCFGKVQHWFRNILPCNRVKEEPVSITISVVPDEQLSPAETASERIAVKINGTSPENPKLASSLCDVDGGQDDSSTPLLAKKTSPDDIKALRWLTECVRSMKELGKYLDQDPTEIQKPTFKDLGHYLGKKDYEIDNDQFTYRGLQSITQRYIIEMTHRGLGLTHLTTFLRCYEKTSAFGKDLEEKFLCRDC